MVTYILQYSSGNGVWQNYVNHHNFPVEFIYFYDAEQVANDHKMGNVLWQAKSSKGETFPINFKVNNVS